MAEEFGDDSDGFGDDFAEDSDGGGGDGGAGVGGFGRVEETFSNDGFDDDDGDFY
jgi:hypothetical protein